MIMATINLPKFLTNHYKGGVSIRDVLKEAITNSIQAGSNKITVKLEFLDKNTACLEDDIPSPKSHLDKVLIIDNGEGFTEENLNYFNEICTSHKDAIGGKGVGRLSYLKFANSINVESYLINKIVKFKYTSSFTLDDVVYENTQNKIHKTIISIQDFNYKVNTQVSKLVSNLCDDLKLLLFLLYDNGKGRNIEINFNHNSQQNFDKTFSFSSAKIQSLAEKSKEINEHKFNFYLFSDDGKGISAFLCADKLVVETLTVSKRFDANKYSIFIMSEYFDNRSNLERQKILIPENETDADLISNLSREFLIPKLRECCIEMMNEFAQQDLNKFKISNIQKLKKYYPFIDLSSLNGQASLLDADEIIKNYRAQKAKQEDSIVESLENKEHVSLDDISHLASDDLARFIVHRALIIDSLSRLPLDSLEDAIHDAIIPRKSDGSNIQDNNIWLIDDKFLSYSSVFSDQALSNIILETTNEAEKEWKRRPDVAVFFSKDGQDSPNKMVVVEFKKYDSDLFESAKSLTQCRYYTNKLVDRVDTVREVFAFAIVKIDDDFYRDLKQIGYIDVFSMNERVLYQSFKTGRESDVPLNLYVMSVDSLIKDAKARNSVFEKILQFNINQFDKLSATNQSTTVDTVDSQIA